MTSEASGDGNQRRNKRGKHRNTPEDADQSRARLSLRESKLKVAAAAVSLLTLTVTGAPEVVRKLGETTSNQRSAPEITRAGRCTAVPAKVSDPEDVVLHCEDMSPGEMLSIHLKSGPKKDLELLQKKGVAVKDFWIFIDLSHRLTKNSRTAELFVVGNTGTLSSTKITLVD
jgi:hypothetical protein